MKKRISSVAMRWIALVMAFCLALPTGSVPAFAIEADTEDVAVSANRMVATEEEDVDAEDAVLETVIPLTFGEEATLTDLKPVEDYRLLVTIPEKEEGDESYDYYRLTVDGKTVNYMSTYVADSNIQWGFGIVYLQPGTYEMVVQNDIVTEHKVCLKEADITSVTAALNNNEYIIGSNKSLDAEGMDITITFGDGTVETWDTTGLNNISVSQTSWDKETGNSALVAGKTYTALYTIWGKTDIEVAYTAVENTITSIAFKEAQETRVICEDSNFSNYYWITIDSDEVFVVTEDGEEKEYTYSELDSKYGVSKGVYCNGGVYLDTVSGNGYLEGSATGIANLTGIEDDKNITAHVVVGSASCSFNVELIRNPIASISVNQLPYKTVYTEGESSVSLEGLELVVNYENGTQEVVSYNANSSPYYYISSGFQDNMGVAYLEPGEYVYNLFYGNAMTSITLTVVASDIKDIAVISGAENFVYEAGERVEMQPGINLTLQFTYSDDSQKTAIYNCGSWSSTVLYYNNMDDSSDSFCLDYSEVDFETEGSYVGYIDYMGIQVEVPIVITASTVTNVSVDFTRMQKDYIVGTDNYMQNAAFDVTVEYEDGTQRTYNSGEISKRTYFLYKNVSGVWSKTETTSVLSLGTHTLYVQVFGKTFECDVNIIENPVESVEIISGETQTFIQGEDTHMLGSGLTLRVSYKDDAIADKEVEVTDPWNAWEDSDYPGGKADYYYTGVQGDTWSTNWVSGLEAGTYAAKFRAYGFNLEYTVVIKETPVESVTATIPDGYKTFVKGEEYWLSPYNLKMQISATYKDEAIGTKYFDMADSGSWTDTDYSDRNVSPSNIRIKKDGNIISYGEISVANLPTGTYEIEFVIYGHTTSATIEIIESPVESVSFIPQSSSFQEGTYSGIQTYGGTINVTYTDGTTASFENHGGWIDPKLSTTRYQSMTGGYTKDDNGNPVYNTEDLEPGVYAAYVVIYGKEVSFDITVTQNPILSVEVLEAADEFVEGTSNSLYDAVKKLRFHMINDYTVDYNVDCGWVEDLNTEIDDVYVTVGGERYSNTDSLEAGTYTVTVEVKGKEATFEITIIETPVESISVKVPENRKKFMVCSWEYIGNAGIELTVHYKDSAKADKVILCDGRTEWTDSDFPGGKGYFAQHVEVEDEWGNKWYSNYIEPELKPGMHTVRVKAYGCETSYEIEVEKPDVTAISLDTTDWEKTYIANAYEYVTYDRKDITVTFGDGTSSSLYDLMFEENEEEDESKYYSTYASNFNRFIKNADGEMFDFDGNVSDFEAGTYEVIVDLFGCKDSYEIELKPSNIETFEISKNPNMMTYLDWEESCISYGGMEFTLTYNDGTASKTVKLDECYDEEMDEYYIDGKRLDFFRNGMDEAIEVTVCYLDKRASYEIKRGLPDTSLAVSVKAEESFLTKITSPGAYGYYVFEPEETASYYVYSKGEFDTYGGIFDESGDCLAEDDDGANDEYCNFRLNVRLQAGQKYYIVSKMLGSRTIGNFATVISKQKKLVVTEKQKITDVKLKIDNPKAGGKKPKWHEVTDDSKSNAYLITDVKWTESEDMDQEGKFKPGKIYEVEIVLTPLDNYKFTTETKISVNTKRPTYKRIGSDGTLTLRFTFGHTKYKVNVPKSEDYDVEFDANNPEYYGEGDRCKFKVSPRKDGKKVVVKRNGTIIKPDEEGYYEIGDFDANVDVSVSVTEPEVTEDTVFVNYYDGDELYDQIVVTKGKSVFAGSEEKNLPQLKNYADGSDQFFLGWYTQDGTRYTKNTKIDKETTLYSKWTKGIFQQKSGSMIVTYKMISVTESGKIRHQISSVKAEEASAARETLSFLADLINPDRADEGAFVIPSEADLTDIAEDLESEVVSVAEAAFEGNTEITSVTIPSTVESIGANAFSGCTSLTEVSMEDGVKEIGNSAFDGCTGLEEVKIPETVTTIGDSAFKDSGLKQITLPDSVETVGADAFAKTTSSEEEPQTMEVLCSSFLKEQIAEEIENAGAKVVNFELTINHDFHEIAVEYKGDTITVSANAIKNDEDISDQITWSVEKGGDEWITVTDKGGGYVEITPIKLTKESVKLTASCEDAKKDLYVKVDRKVVNEEDVVITLDKDVYDYVGVDIVPVVESVTIDGETIPEDEYEYTYENEFETRSGYVSVTFDNYTVENEDEIITVTKGYTIRLPEIEAISLSSSALTMNIGDKQEITASFTPSYVYYKDINWESDNETVATVKDGVITAKAAGSATITATSSYDESKYATCVVTVKAKEAVKPSHTCTWADGAVVKAKPGKNGSVSQKCNGCGAVKQKSVIYAPQKVELSATDCTYNKKEQKPSVKVLDSQGKVIPAANYTVTYNNNKNIGKATVTVTFKGSTYEGSMNQTFNINPVKTKFSKVKAAKKKITVKWKKVKKNITGYQIQYSMDSDFAKAKTVTVKGAKKTSKTISKLKSKKKYYVRIRTYKTVNGTKYYSEWSKAKKVKVK